MGFLVIDFRMLSEDPGDVGGQGAVDIDGHRVHGPFFVKFMQDIEHGLGPAVGKGRDDDRAFPFKGFRARIRLQGRLHVAGPVREAGRRRCFP